MTKEEFGHQIQLHGFMYESTLHYYTRSKSWGGMCCAKYELVFSVILNRCSLYDRIKKVTRDSDDIVKIWNDEVEKYRTKLDNLNKLKKAL